MERLPKRPCFNVFFRKALNRVIWAQPVFKCERGQPAIGYTCCMLRHKADTFYMTERVFVSCENGPSFLHPLIQHLKLGNAHAGENIAQSVIVPDFAVLIMNSRFSCLRSEKSRFFNGSFIV